MKMLLHNCDDADDSKLVTIEAGSITSIVSNEKNRYTAGNLRIFKWLITINLAVLFFFCIYALLSLFQLESALRSSKDNVLFSDRQDIGTESSAGIIDFNESAIASDFRESQKPMRESSTADDDKVAAKTLDLSSFLRAITDIVKNLIESHNVTAERDSRIRAAVSNSTIVQSQLVVTNLTDFEARMLNEFTRLMVLRKRKSRNARIRRTVKGGKDQSGCDLGFSLDVATGKEQPIRVMVQPKRLKADEPMSAYTKNEVDDAKTRECTFNIVYKKN